MKQSVAIAQASFRVRVASSAVLLRVLFKASDAVTAPHLAVHWQPDGPHAAQSAGLLVATVPAPGVAVF